MCTRVCARGSVALEPWLAHAVRQQARLVQSLPLCYATLLGTHNSAISLADGYGALDDVYRAYFKYIRWALHDFSSAPLHTNDQLFSLTDQLNMGVRAVELDTHWVRPLGARTGPQVAVGHRRGLHKGPFTPLLGRGAASLRADPDAVERMLRCIGIPASFAPSPPPTHTHSLPGGWRAAHRTLRRAARAAAQPPGGRDQPGGASDALPHTLGHRDGGLRALALLHTRHGAAPAHRRAAGAAGWAAGAVPAASHPRTAARAVSAHCGDWRAWYGCN